MQERRFDQACAILEGSLAMQVDEPVFLLKLGECLLELGRVNEAERRIREALEERPHQPRANYALGLALEARHEDDAARRAYETELAINPQTWSAAFNLGKLHLAAGRASDAVTAFRHAATVQPAFAANALYLAKALLDAGDLTGAEAAAREGLGRTRQDHLRAFGHYVLADVYGSLSRPRDAARHAALAQQLDPERP